MNPAVPLTILSVCLLAFYAVAALFERGPAAHRVQSVDAAPIVAAAVPPALLPNGEIESELEHARRPWRGTRRQFQHGH